MWDCAVTSYTANTITRNGVTQLSDWAVSKDVTAPAQTPTPTPTASRTPTPTTTVTPPTTPTPTPTLTLTPATGAISGTVWLDANGDAARDANEPGLSGVTLRLFRAGQQVGQTETGSDGTYRFASLLPVAHTVAEVQPPRLRWSTTPDELAVTLSAGTEVEVNFGDWNGRPTYLPLILQLIESQGPQT